MKSICILLSVFFTFSNASIVNGDLILGTGDWTATVTGQGYSNESFSGSATFVYDSDDITGIGEESLTGSLLEFSQSPSPVGETVFDTSNTGFVVGFVNGDVLQTRIGAIVGGIENVLSLEDDFAVLDRSASSDLFTVSIGDEPGAGFGTNVIANFTFAPLILGDINCDGDVNLLDVTPFVDLVSSGGYSPKGDFDGDGAVNLLDVTPFVDILTGG